MHSTPAIRRLLSAAVTLTVFAAITGFLVWSGRQNETDRARADEAKAKEESARSWPLYGGTVQRNLVNTFEKNIPTEWKVEGDDKKNVKWSVELGSRSYGGPIFSGGRIFLGTNNENPRDKAIKGDKGVLLCLDEKTGNFLWQAIHDKLPAGRVVDWPLQGICSSPVVEGNRLWYVSNRCEVICADVAGDPANKGKSKTLWHLDMIKDLGVFPHNLATCSPLIVGDTLFVITSNGVDEGHINIPKPAAPSFLAIDKNTGKVLWKDNSPSKNLLTMKDRGVKALVDRGLLLMHGQWSNPVYAAPKGGEPQILFPGGDGWIYSFEPKTGKLIWKFDCNPKDSFYVLGGKGTRNDFVSTPVIYDDRLYIAVGQDPEHNEGVGHLWCIDLTKKGDVSPELITDDTNFPPKTKANPDSAKLWHFGGPTTPEDKKKLGGRNYYFGRSLSTCSIYEGLLYTADLNGYVYCLDAKTGEKYWDHNMKNSTWSSPYWVDGKVYIGNDDSKVLVFKHGKKRELLAENDMTVMMNDDKVRATPVAMNGVLYVMTENKLYAISNQGK